MAIYYDGYDWDVDGFPGEYVYGDHIYVDDFYMDERWKPVYGYPGYWISNKARVYGPGRYGYGQFLTPTPDRTGHLYVTLTNECGHKRAYVHRLVAEAFISNPKNLPMVRHLDDIADHAERELGIGSRMINRVIKGYRPHTHGYAFEYVYERGTPKK